MRIQFENVIYFFDKLTIIQKSNEKLRVILNENTNNVL